jgi:glc operon protein GlcG
MKTASYQPILAALGLLLTLAPAPAATLGTTRTLTLEVARAIVAAAEKKAAENKWAMVVAVLDDGGNLLQLERMDDAPIGSVEVAQQKAHSSVIFKSPTKDFADGLKQGTTALLKLDVIPFAGGIPIVIDGRIIGAIGVSGGAADSMDAIAAQAGVDWFNANFKSTK